jgi:hypothetical protein
MEFQHPDTHFPPEGQNFVQKWIFEKWSFLAFFGIFKKSRKIMILDPCRIITFYGCRQNHVGWVKKIHVSLDGLDVKIRPPVVCEPVSLGVWFVDFPRGRLLLEMDRLSQKKCVLVHVLGSKKVRFWLPFRYHFRQEKRAMLDGIFAGF